MDCPACKTANLSMTERRGIEIDYCPKCRGVWLDRGELDKIVERSAELASAARAQSPPGATVPAAGAPYGDGGYRPRHGDRHHGSHDRKSFWKELFD